MKYRRFILLWFIVCFIILTAIGCTNYFVDPFFHYHKPKTDLFFYVINNERSQNNGIIKNFDYDTLITGTSMTENFKTSELNKMFNCNSIKVPFSGGSYKEINDNIEFALKKNENLKRIIRCIDMDRFFDDKDAMRNDLGKYPTYLYDENIFNDVYYLFNKDIFINRTFLMIKKGNKDSYSTGITSFDDCYRWHNEYKYGKEEVIPGGLKVEKTNNLIHLSIEEKHRIKENVEQNIVSTAKKYNQINFIYFFSPYSIAWWGKQINDFNIYKQIEAEKYIIELILECDNIRLFSFNLKSDLITNLNYYKDFIHYGEWVNSYILEWIYKNEGLITRDNYIDYINKELDFFINFEYSCLQ